VFALCDGVGNVTGSVLFPFFIAVGPPYFSLLFWLFWTVTKKCKNGENKQRKEEKGVNKNNQLGRRRKKEVRYFLSGLLLRIDSAVTSVLRLSTLRSLPSHFITRRHFRFNFFFLFFSCRLGDISKSEHPRW
jgi:hypothetical protein